MIKQETAKMIWSCYQEIQVGERLIANLEESIASGEDPASLDTRGQRQRYDLGFPTDPASKRLCNIRPELALSVIRAHVAEKHQELAVANESARSELGPAPAPPI